MPHRKKVNAISLIHAS